MTLGRTRNPTTNPFKLALMMTILVTAFGILGVMISIENIPTADAISSRGSGGNHGQSNYVDNQSNNNNVNFN